jgi:hypothetical protein
MTAAHVPRGQTSPGALHLPAGGTEAGQVEARFSALLSGPPDVLSRGAFPAELTLKAGSTSPLVSLFSQMDSVVVQDRHTPFGIAKTLEVGFQDTGSGAVGVHAHLVGGQVSAVIQVEKEQARSMVAHELPAVQQFLGLAHVDVRHVSVDISDRGAGQPADTEPETAPKDQRPRREEAARPDNSSPQAISSQYEPEGRPLLSVEA